MEALPVRVLLIEDDPDDYVLVSSLLSDVPFTRYELEWVKTYNDAIQRMTHGQYDVYLIDYHLAERTGLDLLREATSKTVICGAPAILLTGREDRELDVEAMQTGVVDFLMKAELSASLLERSIRYAIDRRHVERILKKHVLFLQTLIDTIPNPIFYKGCDGLYQGCNKAFEQFFGKAREEIVGKSIFDIVPKDLGKIYQEKDEELFREPGVQTYEASVLCADGCPREVIFNKASYENADHTVAGLVGVILDITERKRSETELRKERDFNRSLVQGSPAYFVALDPEGRILMANEALLKASGYTMDELVGKDSITGFIPEVDRETAVEAQRKVLQHKENVYAETHIFTKTGRELLVGWHGRPVPGEKGEVEYHFWLGIDLTKQRLLEQIVNTRQKMASLGRVAAGIAHEIRNPLSGINMLLDGIRESFRNPESEQDVEALISGAKAASAKIESVVKRVLDYSRPHVPQLALTNINISIEKAVELSSTSLRRAGVCMKTELADDLPQIYVDIPLIEQVMLNLIINAAEALEKDCVRREIRIRSAEAQGCVEIDVCDSGPGIPRNLREKIFDPFYTTKDHGSGIGLSLCHRIVTDHEGTLEVGSSELGGARFTIRIPIEKRKRG